MDPCVRQMYRELLRPYGLVVSGRYPHYRAVCVEYALAIDFTTLPVQTFWVEPSIRDGFRWARKRKPYGNYTVPLFVFVFVVAMLTYFPHMAIEKLRYWHRSQHWTKR
jgi:hypothetical protein